MGTLVQLEGNVKSGRAAELEEFLRLRLPETRAYDGCQEIIGYLSEDKTTAVFVEQWDSKSHYEKYLAWREETGVLADLTDFFEGPPTIRFFDAMDA